MKDRIENVVDIARTADIPEEFDLHCNEAQQLFKLDNEFDRIWLAYRYGVIWGKQLSAFNRKTDVHIESNCVRKGHGKDTEHSY